NVYKRQAEPLVVVAERHPRRIALCDDDQRLSYADLLQRCRRLAAGLRQAAAGPLYPPDPADEEHTFDLVYRFITKKVILRRPRTPYFA
ncbi:hypothetical protein CAZ14_35805, partial [Pseudomonas aeruginosa]